MSHFAQVRIGGHDERGSPVVHYDTIIEPFRIHTVQAIDLPDEAARIAALERSGYNLFGLSKRKTR